MNIWEKLPRPFLILAPMEGVTDIVFREIVDICGRPDLFYTEFTNVSSYASEKGRANALERLAIRDGEQPIIAQIWSKNPEHFGIVAKDLEKLGFAGVDLNFGCPDKNVNRAGGGAAMIKTPELAVECLRNVMTATKLPVSVKTRLGWGRAEESKTWLPVILQEKPAALTVHLRTKKEMSKVPAHYEQIPEIIMLRNAISPETKLVINGDIVDKKQALKLWTKYPEVDGFMIGRGVFKNPYCFTEHTPTKKELMGLLKKHLELFEENANRPLIGICDNGREQGSELRNDGSERGSDEKTHSRFPSYEPLKHFFKIYVNNFPGAGELRAKLMETHSVEEARRVLKEAGEL